MMHKNHKQLMVLLAMFSVSLQACKGTAVESASAVEQSSGDSSGSPSASPAASPAASPSPGASPSSSPDPNAVSSWTKMSVGLSGRSGAATVWTGTDLIIWGGFNFLGVLNDGEIYHPTTNTWSKMSSENAPSQRYNSTAFWTGSKIMVWGGHSLTYTTSLLSDGGLYDPVTDSWSAMSTDNAPSMRQDYVALWTGSKMIIWGGRNPYVGTGMSDGAIYDPSDNSWKKIYAPYGGFMANAIWTGSKMIIWGGGGGNSFIGGAIYELSTDTWTSISTINAPIAIMDFNVVWTGSKLIVWGGMGSTGGHHNLGGIYDPDTDTWSPMSTINAPADTYYDYVFTAIWTGSRMFVWGKVNNDGTIQGGLYDPETDTWSKISELSAPSPREGSIAIWTGSKVIVWGGSGGSGAPLNDGGIYDPDTDTWSPLSSQNSPENRPMPLKYPYSSGTNNTYTTNIWTGTSLIVWGGMSNTSIYLNDGAIFTP